PETFDVYINKKGIQVNKLVFVYSSLESFNIDEAKGKLYLESKRLLSPHISIPIPEEIDTEDLQDFLLEYLDLEDDLQESFFEEVMEYLGF
ncbi:MAG: hypothetical protein MRY49_03055, partial [Candidatus Pacebacteria bacterium]|nr:hypothetical protein [Candidatus Paceibacterota bacterium]